MKLKILFLLLFMTPGPHVFSQTTDSVSIKKRLAEKDVRHFRLDNQRWLDFKNHQIDYTSDYFKPGLSNSSNPKLLSDSIYVRAYRLEALKKTIERRTIGHHILLWTITYIVGSLAAFGLVVVIILSKG